MTYSATVADGNWHHYAFVVPDIVGVELEDVEIYQDGILLSTICGSIALSVPLDTRSTYPIHVGRFHEWSERHFIGTIDEVMVYDRALSVEEIQQIADTCLDHDGDGFIIDDPSCGGDDCDDWDSLVYPDAEEVCDGKDSDCDGILPADEVDGDGDGSPLCADCDDADPVAYPGAPEICDGKDNDCDGIMEMEADADVDGWRECEGDCDDTDPEINPGAVEICDDGVDNDCDGLVDDDDMDCAPFILEMDASYSTSAPGMLDLDFRIAAAEQCLWMNVAITPFPSIQIFPLWMEFLPVTHPAVDMEVSIPFPDIGWVIIYSGLYYEGSKRVSDMEWVHTGK